MPYKNRKILLQHESLAKHINYNAHIHTKWKRERNGKHKEKQKAHRV